MFGAVFMEEEYKRVAIIENEIEALLVDMVLNQMDVPHILVSYYDTAYDGLFQTQKGWGYVSAPERFRDRVNEVIMEIRESGKSKEH